MRDEWEGHGNGSFGSFPPYPPLPCRFGTVSMSLSALFSSLRSSEPSAVRPEGPPETNGMRRGKGVRKETKRDREVGCYAHSFSPFITQPLFPRSLRSFPRFTLLSPASLIRLTSPLLTPRRGPVSDRREGSRMERVARQTVTRPSGRRDRGTRNKLEE